MTATIIPFTRIPDAVLLDPRLTAVQLRIYAVIARRLGSDTTSAFPRAICASRRSRAVRAI
ncbi:MAG: hypothetical protein DCC53_07375 [Chloroflexi bacterium]|nr:MAG: hypothetical protein DCC53_07375 [Chloroflexota bacterium]